MGKFKSFLRLEILGVDFFTNLPQWKVANVKFFLTKFSFNGLAAPQKPYQRAF